MSDQVESLRSQVEQLQTLVLKLAGPTPLGSVHIPGLLVAPDFGSVTCGNEWFYFTSKNQRATMKVLWQTHQTGYGLAISAMAIAERIGAEVTSFRLSKVFPGHPAWRKLITSPARGMYRLDDPRR